MRRIHALCVLLLVDFPMLLSGLPPFEPLLSLPFPPPPFRRFREKSAVWADDASGESIVKIVSDGKDESQRSKHPTLIVSRTRKIQPPFVAGIIVLA